MLYDYDNANARIIFGLSETDIESESVSAVSLNCMRMLITLQQTHYHKRMK